MLTLSRNVLPRVSVMPLTAKSPLAAVMFKIRDCTWASIVSRSGPSPVIVSASVILSECHYNRKIEQCGALPEGYRTFGIPANEALSLRWRGKNVGPENLLLFPRGSQLDSVSNPGFHVFAFSVSERALEQAAERRGLSSVDELFPCTDLVKCSRSKLLYLRELAASLTDMARTQPGIVNVPSFLDSLEDELVTGVLDAATGGDPMKDSPPMAQQRSRGLKQALDIIADRAAEPVTMAELEKLSRVSGRTLRYAFEEAFSLSPKQYLQNYRLNRTAPYKKI